MSDVNEDERPQAEAPNAKTPNARRAFLRGAALIAMAAPVLTEGGLARAAQAQANAAPTPTGMALHGQGRATPKAGAVLINANENPLGPCKAACEAIAKMGPIGGRYDLLGETDKLAETFAAQSGLPKDHIAVYAGSSEPLHFTVMAFTGPDRPLVMADPSYEAPMVAAMSSGAPIKKVALTGGYAHDVKALVAAAPNAGVIYICNPNNPTGTMTPREDILWAIDNKPKGAVVLVDEAYIHLSGAPDVLDQVKAGKDVVVLRTFSKIYGMAGIRCGFALGRPDLLAKMQPYGYNAMPITGSAAARASLEDAALVPERRKIIADNRMDTVSWLKANGYKVIGDSKSNCFMIDTGRDGHAMMRAMAAKNVMIGRVWPVWPNAVRISVGTHDEMAAFKTAFHEVMSQPLSAAALAEPAAHGRSYG